MTKRLKKNRKSEANGGLTCEEEQEDGKMNVIISLHNRNLEMHCTCCGCTPELFISSSTNSFQYSLHPCEESLSDVHNFFGKTY